MARISLALEQLATALGVETSYEDVNHQRQTADLDSLLAVLRLLGANCETPEDAPEALRKHQQALASRGIEPVLVAWDGRATEFDLTAPHRRGGEPAALHLAQRGRHRAADHVSRAGRLPLVRSSARVGARLRDSPPAHARRPGPGLSSAVG